MANLSKLKAPSKIQRIHDLERQLLETKAQLLSTRVAALKSVNTSLTGSAAIITITALGERVIVAPVAITDGLSTDTIQCLEADIRRSIDYSTSMVPKT